MLRRGVGAEGAAGIVAAAGGVGAEGIAGIVAAAGAGATTAGDALAGIATQRWLKDGRAGGWDSWSGGAADAM